MRYIINSQVLLSRTSDGPLVAHIGPFAQSQSVQGYARHSIRQQVRLSLQVSTIGYNNSESFYVMSDPIISRGICVIALAACGLARVMSRRSGTS